ARGVHRQGSQGAARAGRHGARAGRAGAARARRPRRRRPCGARHARRQAAGAQSVHLLFVPRRAGARGAPARRGSPEGHEAARAAVWQGHGPHGPHGSPLMSRNLLVRIAVAVPAIAVSVAVVWLGGWVLATALAVLGVLGTREVYDLARRDGIEPFDRLGLV